ncbi:MAG: alpha/beta hydrolase [Nitrososphaerales archaeon]|nr:alpha/beta hydrolase [Nitrososphaerales archaeon]
MQPTEKKVAAGEFTVNCATVGKGENIVLLHGSDHRESWRVWEPMLPLGDAYSLIMPDLIGYGGSSAPTETPDYRAQARVVKDLLERLSVENTNLMGTSWGGQVALEFALEWPDSVKAIVLIASAYDKEQLQRLQKLRKPTLIVYAEDDMMTQLKAGYLLRDAIGTSRLEVLEPVARDPAHDFTISHKLERFRAPLVLQLVRLFLSKPAEMIAEPPEMENELKGMALRKNDDDDTGKRE